MKIILVFFVSMLFACCVNSQSLRISGTISSDADHEPLPGTSLTVTGTTISSVTSTIGAFSMRVPPHHTLLISHIGFETLRLNTDSIGNLPLSLFLRKSSVVLNNVTVSTGYEQFDTRKTTGSFVKIDNDLFNRSTGTSILSRLDGVAPSVLFDHRSTADAPIQIRGVSSLGYASTAPLIILDNFPYEGELNNINPMDVESVTILKDAAASSIWGARAGNGVIVITTKKGRFNQPMRLSFSTDIITTAKPDLFLQKNMSTSDYIDVEQFLFNKGYYNSSINNTRSFPPLGPVVEILLKQREGLITEADATTQINALRNLDVTNDFEKYLYRPDITQQYGINLSGGGSNYRYMLTGGYDKDVATLVGNKNDRITLLLKNTFEPIKKLRMDFSLGYSRSNAVNNSPGGYNDITIVRTGMPLYPYLQFVDASGNPVPIDYYYSSRFTDTAGGGKLLDWSYNPLTELKNVNRTTITDALILNAGIQYSLSRSLSAEVKYQYQNNNTNSSNIYNINSFEANNLINEFTQYDGTNITYIVPYGGILDAGQNQLHSYDIRGQLNFNKSFGGKNVINAIAGAEARQANTTSSQYRTYGYDDKLNYTNVDYTNAYPTFDNVAGNAMIPPSNNFSYLLDRNTSFYSNINYTYNNEFILSGSFRKDASNLFGVNANQKGVPLWSSGAAWNISNEKFYHLQWLPYLKVRATYGYGGNVSNSVSALTTITYNPASYQPVTNLPYAIISNYPNPNLQWEKVGMMNIGLDFGSINSRITGSVEYYQKKSTDILGSQQLDPTVGTSLLTTNSADMTGHGMDIVINSRNISHKSFLWETNFFLSTVHNKVTRYLFGAYTNGYTSNGTNIDPLPGYDPYALVSFKWAGLDSLGNPQGYVNGKKSSDYNALFNTPLNEQVVGGSGLPRYFGSLRNNLSWKGFSFSFNIIYRFDYYFRRPSLSYYSLFKYGEGNPEYSKRWQNPGDEKITNVPSLIYPVKSKRDAFYQQSEINVEKADNVRINDMRLGYKLLGGMMKKFHLQNFELYSYISNLNLLLWKENKEGIDPDFPTGLRMPASISFGLKTDF